MAPSLQVTVGTDDVQPLEVATMIEDGSGDHTQPSLAKNDRAACTTTRTPTLVEQCTVSIDMSDLEMSCLGGSDGTAEVEIVPCPETVDSDRTGIARFRCQTRGAWRTRAADRDHRPEQPSRNPEYRYPLRTIHSGEKSRPVRPRRLKSRSPISNLPDSLRKKPTRLQEPRLYSNITSRLKDAKHRPRTNGECTSLKRKTC